MSWDQVLMVFVDLITNNGGGKDFFVTAKEIVDVTGLSHQSVSRNLAVCVKDGFLVKKEFFTNKGRVVRYYLKDDEVFRFVEKFLR